MHVDIPEGDCRTHLGWRSETVLVVLSFAQQSDVPISQQLGFQEKMNDGLRIAVAEACNGAREVAQRTVASPCQARSGGGSSRTGGRQAGLLLALVAWRWWTAQSFKAAALLHTDIPTTTTTLRNPTCTTPADCTDTRDSTPIIIHAFLVSTEQTPTSASRPNHGPTYAARWSPRRRAVCTVQACASGLVAIPC